MSILAAWLVVGVPAAVLAAALFYGRSRARAMLGYVVLLVAFSVMAVVDVASGALFGLAIALLYAAGEGGQADEQPFNTSTLAVPDEVRRPVRSSSSGDS